MYGVHSRHSPLGGDPRVCQANFYLENGSFRSPSAFSARGLLKHHPPQNLAPQSKMRKSKMSHACPWHSPPPPGRCSLPSKKAGYSRFTCVKYGTSRPCEGLVPARPQPGGRPEQPRRQRPARRGRRQRAAGGRGEPPDCRPSGGRGETPERALHGAAWLGHPPPHAHAGGGRRSLAVHNAGLESGTRPETSAWL